MLVQAAFLLRFGWGSLSRSFRFWPRAGRLLGSVRLRLCMSVCIAAHQQAQQPENEYLGISQRLIEETLPRLLNP